MARSKSEFLQERRVLHRGHADVKDPLFREGTFFDPRDLMLVKYEMLRKVRLGQCSVTQACRDFGLSRTVYYEAYQAWQKEGMVGLLPARSGPQGPHKMTEPVTTFLEGLLAENGAASAETLAKELKRQMGLEVPADQRPHACRCDPTSGPRATDASAGLAEPRIAELRRLMSGLVFRPAPAILPF